LPANKLALFDSRFLRILTGHEGIRRTAHVFLAPLLSTLSHGRGIRITMSATCSIRCSHQKGYRTMLTIHDQSCQLSDRLATTCVGLGLIRLLQDAKRFEEANATLFLLEFGVQDESAEPKQPSMTNRLTRIARSNSRTKRIDAA
jgi:hypothetical protein